MDTLRKRYDTLLRAMLDSQATDDQRDEFMRLLIEHPRLADEFAAELSIHSLLQWQSEDLTADLAASPAAGFDQEGQFMEDVENAPGLPHSASREDSFESSSGSPDVFTVPFRPCSLP